MLTILAHLFDVGYSDGVGQILDDARVLANLLQSYKVSENAALSDGVFADWELLPFPDPEGVGRSPALPAERCNVSDQLDLCVIASEKKLRKKWYS